MRKLIVSVNVTLDGFMSGPMGELDWHFPYWTDAMTNYAIEQLGFADTLLLGRKTYETMAGHWPSAASNVFTDLMNGHKKLVFSTTMQQSCWRPVTVFPGNLVATIGQQKEATGKSIIIYGSRSIVNELAGTGLIDEYRLWIHPVLLGKGITLFDNRPEQQHLTLLRTHVFNTGVVLHAYSTTNAVE